MADVGRRAEVDDRVRDQQCIGAEFDRGLDQGLAGGHPRRQATHLGPTLDLQAVRTVILESLGLQHLIAITAQLGQTDWHGHSPSVCTLIRVWFKLCLCLQVR